MLHRTRSASASDCYSADLAGDRQVLERMTHTDLGKFSDKSDKKQLGVFSTTNSNQLITVETRQNKKVSKANKSRTLLR